MDDATSCGSSLNAVDPHFKLCPEFEAFFECCITITLFQKYLIAKGRHQLTRTEHVRCVSSAEPHGDLISIHRHMILQVDGILHIYFSNNCITYRCFPNHHLLSGCRMCLKPHYDNSVQKSDWPCEHISC